MPNGEEKNWGRLRAAVEGFRIRHGTWPTRVRIMRMCYEDLRDHLFTEQSFRQIEKHIEFVLDESEFIAEDGSGRRFRYGRDRAPHNEGVSAAEWLGVEPDRYPLD